MNLKYAAVLPLVLLAGLVTAQPGWTHDDDDYGRNSCHSGFNQSNGYRNDGDRHERREWQRRAYNAYNPGYNQAYNQGYNNNNYYNQGYNVYNPGYNNAGNYYNNGYNASNYDGRMPVSYRVRNWLGNL